MEPNGRAWPADKVERRPVAELVPYARNARTHSDAQVEQIVASIREWGWTTPVLVDEVGSIIAGHGRVLAAGRLGLGDVPVMVARGWTEAQKNAYRLADNKLSENGGWDEALLRLEVQDLAALGFDVPLMGFSAQEVARLTGSNPGLAEFHRREGQAELTRDRAEAEADLAASIKWAFAHIRKRIAAGGPKGWAAADYGKEKAPREGRGHEASRLRNSALVRRALNGSPASARIIEVKADIIGGRKEPLVFRASRRGMIQRTFHAPKHPVCVN